MAGRGNPGTPITFRRPVYVGGLRETKAVESLGSTSGNISRYGATIITAAATGLVYTLAAPRPGDIKKLQVNYSGETDDLVVACASTAQSFNGGAANTIVVSSSQSNITVDLYGLSTAIWWAMVAGDAALLAATTNTVFTESTVATSTDRLT